MAAPGQSFKISLLVFGQVYAGHYNSFAISKVEGQPSLVFAWGLARYGMLGVGESKAICCVSERFDPAGVLDWCSYERESDSEPYSEGE